MWRFIAEQLPIERPILGVIQSPRMNFYPATTTMVRMYVLVFWNFGKMD